MSDGKNLMQFVVFSSRLQYEMEQHHSKKEIVQLKNCQMKQARRGETFELLGGKTHTILACVSASGQVLPPFSQQYSMLVIEPFHSRPKNLSKRLYSRAFIETGWQTYLLYLTIHLSSHLSH